VSPGALHVFPDTNTLLSMILFPLDREGRPTLAGEVRALYEAEAFELVVTDAIDREDAPVLAAASAADPTSCSATTSRRSTPRGRCRSGSGTASRSRASTGCCVCSGSGSER